MKKNHILFFIGIMLSLNMVGCTKKIDITQEHDKIMNVAETLIINDFDEHKLDFTRELIEGSIRIHTITEIDGEVYILYSYYRWQDFQAVGSLHYLKLFQKKLEL